MSFSLLIKDVTRLRGKDKTELFDTDFFGF